MYISSPLELANVLDIPLKALEQVQILVDQSTVQPPVTVITFVINNRFGVDPFNKARELKTRSESNDPEMQASPLLAGMKVVSIGNPSDLDKTSSAVEGVHSTPTTIIASMVFVLLSSFMN